VKRFIFLIRTGDLWLLDAYFGLMKVGPEGGLATPVSNEAEGQPFMFANDLDIASDGCIYFTDTSPRWRRRCAKFSIFHFAIGLVR
jgi:sugar lactone lactonase YvrE